MVLSVVFLALASLLTCYALVCTLAVLVTWVRPPEPSALARFLASAAAPWLELFRSRKAQRGGLDFGPMIGIAVLWLLADLLFRVSGGYVITTGLVLSETLLVAWQLASSVLLVYAALDAARILAYFARWNTFGQGWRLVESMLNPAIYRANRLFFGKRVMNYLASLFTLLAVIVALWFGGGALVSWLVPILASVGP